MSDTIDFDVIINQPDREIGYACAFENDNDSTNMTVSCYQDRFTVDEVILNSNDEDAECAFYQDSDCHEWDVTGNLAALNCVLDFWLLSKAREFPEPKEMSFEDAIKHMTDNNLPYCVFVLNEDLKESIL